MSNTVQFVILFGFPAVAAIAFIAGFMKGKLKSRLGTIHEFKRAFSVAQSDYRHDVLYENNPHRGISWSAYAWRVGWLCSDYDDIKKEHNHHKDVDGI